MSGHEAGTVHVHCPRCAAPVIVPVEVSYVGLRGYPDQPAHDVIEVGLRGTVTAPHHCELLP